MRNLFFAITFLFFTTAHGDTQATAQAGYPPPFGTYPQQDACSDFRAANDAYTKALDSADIPTPEDAKAATSQNNNTPASALAAFKKQANACQNATIKLSVTIDDTDDRKVGEADPACKEIYSGCDALKNQDKSSAQDAVDKMQEQIDKLKDEAKQSKKDSFQDQKDQANSAESAQEKQDNFNQQIEAANNKLLEAKTNALANDNKAQETFNTQKVALDNQMNSLVAAARAANLNIQTTINSIKADCSDRGKAAKATLQAQINACKTNTSTSQLACGGTGTNGIWAWQNKLLSIKSQTEQDCLSSKANQVKVQNARDQARLAQQTATDSAGTLSAQNQANLVQLAHAKQADATQLAALTLETKQRLTLIQQQKAAIASMRNQQINGNQSQNSSQEANASAEHLAQLEKEMKVLKKRQECSAGGASTTSTSVDQNRKNAITAYMNLQNQCTGLQSSSGTNIHSCPSVLSICSGLGVTINATQGVTIGGNSATATSATVNSATQRRSTSSSVPTKGAQ